MNPKFISLLYTFFIYLIIASINYHFNPNPSNLIQSKESNIYLIYLDNFTNFFMIHLFLHLCGRCGYKECLQSVLKFKHTSINFANFVHLNEHLITFEKIIKIFVKEVWNICDSKKIDENQKVQDLKSKLKILQSLKLFQCNKKYQQKILLFNQLFGTQRMIQNSLSKQNQKLDKVMNTLDDIRSLQQTINKMEKIKSKFHMTTPKFTQLLEIAYDRLNTIYKKLVNELAQILKKPYQPANQNMILQFQKILIDLESTGYIINPAKVIFQSENQKIFTITKEKIKNELSNIKIKNQDLLDLQNRKQFFTNVQKKVLNCIQIIRNTHMLQYYLRSQCNDGINKQAKLLYDQCISIISKKNIQISQIQIFEFNYNNLKSMKQYITQSKVLTYIEFPSVEEIDRILQKKIDNINNKVNIDDVIGLVDNLVELQYIQNNFICLKGLKAIARKSINQAITNYVQGNKNLSVLIQGLSATKEGIMIMEDNPNFRKIQKNQFGIGIEYILQKISFDGSQDKFILKKRFLNYERKYNELVLQNNNINREEHIKKLVGEVRSKFELKIYDNGKSRSHLILQNNYSHIYLLFSLLQIIKYSFQRLIQGSSSTNNSNIQNIRILTRILEQSCLDTEWLSVIFALNGFYVNCACYSEYLSQRDFENFLPLFKVFGLQQRIFYGTLNKICSMILDENGEVSNLVEDFFTKGDYTIFNKSTKMPKVLLIDEVDVLFSEQFYGKYYQPVFTLKDPLFKALSDFMWNAKANKQMLNLIFHSNQYNNIVKRYSYCKNLIDQIVKSMIYALQILKIAPKGYILSQKIRQNWLSTIGQNKWISNTVHLLQNER